MTAFAGVPLADSDGRTVGALCAIDSRPRDWTERELGLLTDLAAACSTEVRLRAARQQTDELIAQHRTALQRARLQLRAAEAMADTTGLSEVRLQLRELVSGDLEPAYVGLVLTESDGRLSRVRDPQNMSVPLEQHHPRYAADDRWPSAQAARDNRIIVIPDRQTLVDHYDPAALAEFDAMHLRSAVCVPLPGTHQPVLGTLILAWRTPREVDVVERAVLVALAGYAARAVDRAEFVDNRVRTARQMQQALLTELPSVDGIDIASLYRPAADTDLIGGDWYDVYPLDTVPRPTAPVRSAAEIAVTIGDITGHDMRAATLMGQLRSMLRQADHDHPGAGPARAVAAMERAPTSHSVSAPAARSRTPTCGPSRNRRRCRPEHGT